MLNLSRRKALGLIAAVSVPPTIVVAAAPIVAAETPHDKLRRLSWEVADLLDQLSDLHVEYVTIRAAKRAGKAAVFTSFDIPMGDEA